MPKFLVWNHVFCEHKIKHPTTISQSDMLEPIAIFTPRGTHVSLARPLQLQADHSPSAVTPLLAKHLDAQVVRRKSLPKSQWTKWDHSGEDLITNSAHQTLRFNLLRGIQKSPEKPQLHGQHLFASCKNNTSTGPLSFKLSTQKENDHTMGNQPKTRRV